MANTGRRRATRILEMARAIGMLFSEDDTGQDLFDLLGQSAPQARSSAFASWRQGRLAAFQSGGR